MHIPDGFLDPKLVALSDVAAIGLIGLAARKVERKLSPERIPLMGMLGALVFAAQLLTFPVVGGTSAHLVGAVLLAVLLGPFSGFLLMAAVLLLEALLFQHGGILAFGANLLNMGFIGAFGGYFLYRAGGSTPLSAGLSALLTVVISAVLCALELSISGVVSIKTALPAMALTHLITGAIEGIVTFSLLSFLVRGAPEITGGERI